MFFEAINFLKETAGGIVEIGCEIGMGVTRVTCDIGKEIIAGPAEVIFGKNDFSDAARELGTAAADATDAVVDGLVKPVVTAVVTAPLRKAECVGHVVGGLADATLNNNVEEGLKRAAGATGKLALIAVTGGLLHAGGDVIADAVIGLPGPDMLA